MATKLQIENFISLNIKERTRLTADIAIGESSLKLENTNNVTTGDYALIGRPGSEMAEIRAITDVTDATLAVAEPMTLRHDQNEPVLVLLGNRINVYRAPNVNGTQPADNAFASLQIIDIDSDQLTTTFIDPDGSANYWYKYTYINGSGPIESDLGSTGAVRGGVVTGYTTVDDIRQDAGLNNNNNISDVLINKFRVAAQDEINGQLSGRYTVPLTAPVNSFVALIATRLAAGYLLLDQYQGYSSSMTATAKEKIEWATAQLKLIKSGDTLLTDQTGGSTTPQANDFGFTGIPNTTTELEGGANGFMFKAADIHGYNERVY